MNSFPSDNIRIRIVQACAPIFIACLYLIRPLRSIKIGLFGAERIGLMAQTTELYLRRIQLGRLPPSKGVVFIAPTPANKQLLLMYKRLLTIVENDFLSKVMRVWLPWLSKTPFLVRLPGNSNEYEEYGMGHATLSFTPDEVERGRRGLAEMGLSSEDWFVCFHARDSAYLAGKTPGKDWSYHDYRDCDVNNQLKAAKYIAECGGYAIRMGAAVSKPLPTGLHPRIIDYAALHRSDFMDIYLYANCKFLISTDSGTSQVATAFDVPVVNTNVPRIEWASFRPQDIFIHKMLFDESLGRILTYKETLERGHGFFTTSSYLEKHKLRLIENTEEDILDVVREMRERLTGTFHEQPQDLEMQRKYRALFSPGHACYSFQSRIGRDFLRKHKDVVLS